MLRICGAVLAPGRIQDGHLAELVQPGAASTRYELTVHRCPQHVILLASMAPTCGTAVHLNSGARYLAAANLRFYFFIKISTSINKPGLALAEATKVCDLLLEGVLARWYFLLPVCFVRARGCRLPFPSCFSCAFWRCCPTPRGCAPASAARPTRFWCRLRASPFLLRLLLVRLASPSPACLCDSPFWLPDFYCWLFGRWWWVVYSLAWVAFLAARFRSFVWFPRATVARGTTTALAGLRSRADKTTKLLGARWLCRAFCQGTRSTSFVLK